MVPPAIAGRYYDSESLLALNSPSATGLTMVAGRHFAIMSALGIGLYTKLGIYVGTGAAGKLARCSIFAVGSDGLPGALLVDGGSDLDVSAIAEKEHTISFAVSQPRLVYLTVISDGAPAIAGYPTPSRALLGWASGNHTARQAAVFRDTTYGAPGATFGAASFTSTSFPRIWVRV